MMPPVLMSRIDGVISKIESELELSGSPGASPDALLSPPRAGGPEAAEMVDHTIRKMQACEMIQLELEQLHHKASDSNLRGLGSQFRGAAGFDVENEQRLLRQQMEMLQDQLELQRAMVAKGREVSEIGPLEISAMTNREQLLYGELEDAQAISVTAVRQKRAAEEAQRKQRSLDSAHIEELTQLLSQARVEKATAEARVRQGRRIWRASPNWRGRCLHTSTVALHKWRWLGRRVLMPMADPMRNVWPTWKAR